MNKKYSVILADPPWQYRDNKGSRAAGRHYSCMDMSALKAMPIADIAARDCLLAMWYTGPFVRESVDLVDSWGFKVKNAFGFTWVKQTKHGKWFWGMGTMTRANSECCLFAVRGKPKRVSAAVSQLIVAPVREHSRKPDEQYTKLEQLMGDVPRIELFARHRRPGWDVFGNQVEGSITL